MTHNFPTRIIVIYNYLFHHNTNIDRWVASIYFYKGERYKQKDDTER